MKKINIFIFFFFLLNINAYSQENFAVVDIDFLINNSNIGKDIQKSIKIKNEKIINGFEKKEKDYEEREKKLVSQKNIISEEEFSKKVKELKKNIFEYNQKKKQSIQNSQKKSNEAVAKLLSEINKILVEFSKEKNLSFVIDKKNIILTKKNNEITKDILEIMNKKLDKIKVE